MLFPMVLLKYDGGFFMAEKLKLKYGRTLLIGFGFMASMISWTIYNAYVPLILKENETISNLAISGTVIGIIMVIDNIFGVVFQPLFGRLSDTTHTRFGKRTPFLIVGIPVAALLFIFIPRMSQIWFLMPCVILFTFTMSTWRAPVVALMPDLTPPQLRSEANAVINLMGAVGTVLGTVAGKIISGVFHIAENDNAATRNAVFIFGSVIMLICLMIVVFIVKEPDNRLSKIKARLLENEEQIKASKKAEKKKFKEMRLGGPERKSLIFMLVALFFNSNATDSINTYFTTFATTELQMSEKDAPLYITIFAFATVVAAFPAGYLGKRFGRKKTIMIGLGGIVALFLLYFITQSMFMLYVAIVCGGALIALVTINTLPLVLELGGTDRVGTFTGYYYTATFSASIVGPVLCGALFDITDNYWSLFVYCSVCFALALACISQVHHGEAQTISDEMIKEIKMAED
jgi:Na+/melibiose symporter-like transporter